MSRPEEHWYLMVGTATAGPHLVGEIHKSLTQKLLLSRYIACQVLTALRVQGVDISGTEVTIVRDGEVQAKDEF